MASAGIERVLANPARSAADQREQVALAGGLLAGVAGEVLEHALELIPMRRMGKVDEVAGLVAFLMGKDASYITRQVISVNGGMIG